MMESHSEFDRDIRTDGSRWVETIFNACDSIAYDGILLEANAPGAARQRWQKARARKRRLEVSYEDGFWRPRLTSHLTTRSI
jgi:hypothetical protein